jgi:hypothetical protein
VTTELILRPVEKLARYSLNDTAKELKSLALDASALIGKVTNAEENDQAVNAQRELKRVMNMLEKDRKDAKEPLLEAGRQLDSMIAKEKEDIDAELGRVSELVSGFAIKERQRLQEEQRLQQAELERIEREKAAELKRIADEQAKVEREAREAKEAAEKLASEATTKKQVEAANAAKIEAARIAVVAVQTAEVLRDSVKQVEERAADKAYVAAKPIIQTRAEGQRVSEDWEISVTNPYDLARFHPDCVTITPKLTEIKRYLNQGREIQGVVAKKVTKATVTAGRAREAIDV